jgi:hypothetical protein
VEADHSATMQALLVVVIVAIAGGIGGLSGSVGVIIVSLLTVIMAWALWAVLSFVIGTTILKTPETDCNWWQMVRTTGFARLLAS